MVPRCPVVITFAPFSLQRLTTFLSGCPKIDVRPTEIIAQAGLVASTKLSVEDVLLPWCATLTMSLRKSEFVLNIADSPAFSMSPVKRNFRRPNEKRSTIDSLFPDGALESSDGGGHNTSAVTSPKRNLSPAPIIWIGTFCSAIVDAKREYSESSAGTRATMAPRTLKFRA